MGLDRREFIKVGGLITLAGIGAPALVETLMGGRKAEASHGAAEPAQTQSAVRWGMVVDTKAFDSPEKFQKCVKACNDIHNVPDFGNPKDEIKWIWRTPFERAFPGLAHQFPNEGKEDVLALCNHCEKPPCVRVCPTKATFKRAMDGIVMMDYHRCIGCRFCMAACPYGARSFNWRDPRPFVAKIDPTYPTRERGVVEKCTFCAERIEHGKIPACVEASGGALVFGNLNDPASEIREALRKNNTAQRKAELGTNPSVFYIV